MKLLIFDLNNIYPATNPYYLTGRIMLSILRDVAAVRIYAE